MVENHEQVKNELRIHYTGRMHEYRIAPVFKYFRLQVLFLFLCRSLGDWGTPQQIRQPCARIADDLMLSCGSRYFETPLAVRAFVKCGVFAILLALA